MTTQQPHRFPAPAIPAELDPSPPSALLLTGLPDPLDPGSGTALLLRGSLTTGGAALTRPRIRFGEIERELDGWGPDLESGPGDLTWWSLLPIPPEPPLPKPARLDLLGRLAGQDFELPLATARIGNGREAVPEPDLATDGAPTLIAICMAAYEPKPAELERQLDSIREQTWTNWVCLISDDGSSEESYRGIEEAVSGDPRFRLSRSPARGGFYRNFERALGMVPPEAQLVALVDQDDRWHPDKLDLLAAELAAAPGAELAYSDMRIVAEDGTVISDTFWYQSYNSYEDIATLAVVNTVTGAASLFRRRLLDLALPFPPPFSDQHYHDHWLALCALAVGEITYLDRPTYDYTRHAESVTIQASSHWSRPPESRLEQLGLRARQIARRLGKAGAPGVWRRVYFDRFLLIRQFAEVLELRAGARIEPAKRRRLRLLADADRSPRASAFLFGRASRSLLGHKETLGRERVLLGGLLWRWGFAARAWIGAGRARASRGGS